MMYCEVNVGERIRYFRNLRGWSQETLALQAGGISEESQSTAQTIITNLKNMAN